MRLVEEYRSKKESQVDGTGVPEPADKQEDIYAVHEAIDVSTNILTFPNVVLSVLRVLWYSIRDSMNNKTTLPIVCLINYVIDHYVIVIQLKII